MLMRTNMANTFDNNGNAGIYGTVNGNVSNTTTFNTTTQTHCEPKPIRFQVHTEIGNVTGREDELDLLVINHQKLADHEAPIVVVFGKGGIGKTQLVRKFIDRNQSNYKNVIWINSEKRSVMVDQFKELAKRLNIQKVEEKDFSYLIEEVLNKLSVLPTVIVLDNVDELRNTKIVKTLLTISTSGIKPHFIITSQIKEWPKPIRLIELNVFKLKDALDYVSTNLTSKGHNDSQNDKVKLVEMLQYFPLALRQATSHINHHRVEGIYPISQYIREFNMCQDRMLGSNYFQINDLDSYEKTTLTTWKVSIAAISKGTTGSLAVRILRIIAYFDASHIRRDIFLHLQFPINQPVTDTEVISAVRTLVNYSLIDSDNLQSVLSVHRLMQQVIKIEMEKDSKLIQKILGDGLHIISQVEDISDCLEHGISIFLVALKFEKLNFKFNSFPFIIFRSLLDYGQYNRAINFGSEVLHHLSQTDIRDVHQYKRSNKLEMHQEIFEKRKTILWQENRDILDGDFNTVHSNVTNDAHHTDETLGMSQRVLEKRMTNFRDDNPVESHFDVLYVKRANHSEILNLSQKFVDRHEVDSCEDIPLSLESHFKAVYSKSADSSHTIDLSQKVFGKKKLSTEEEEEHQLTLESHFNVLYVKDADHSEKIDVSGKVFEKRKSNVDEDIKNPLILQSHFSVVYVKDDDFGDKIVLSQRVFDKPQITEEFNPENLAKESRCDAVYIKCGKNSKSVTLRVRRFDGTMSNYICDGSAKPIRQKTKLIEHHPNVLDSKFNIANLYNSVGRHCEALQMHQEVFENRKRALGENHLDTLESRSKIATTYNYLGEHSKALQMHRDVFEKLRKILGECHWITLACKSNFAASNNYLGNYLEALKIHEEILELRKYMLGEEHPQTLHSMSNVGVLYAKLEKPHDALQMHKVVFGKRKVVLGENHLDTLNSMSNIAALYSFFGKHSLALQMHQDVFLKLSSIVGSTNPKTLNSKRAIELSAKNVTVESQSLNSILIVSLAMISILFFYMVLSSFGAFFL